MLYHLLQRQQEDLFMIKLNIFLSCLIVPLDFLSFHQISMGSTNNDNASFEKKNYRSFR